MINPVVIDLFWDEKGNGGFFRDIVQIISPFKYRWRSYYDNCIIEMPVMLFLEKMQNTTLSQLNFSENGGLPKFKNDDLVLNFLEGNQELLNLVRQKFGKSYRELEVIATCPICNKIHSVKVRSIKRNQSFICKECATKYGGYSYERGMFLHIQKPDLKNYWCKDNRASFDNTQPLAYREPFNLICANCGKKHVKSYEGILTSDSLCKSCAKIKSTIEKAGSLRDLYPEIADMWDNGNNAVKANNILPSSGKEGTFLCTGGGKPHYFTSQVFSVTSTYENSGNFGCPICANKQVYTGINDFATLYPELTKYWDYNKNELPPEKTLCTNTSHFALICPKCGKHHTKRKDALDRYGALCENCSHTESKLNRGLSLRDMFPEVAEMFDKGGNTVLSSDINYGASEKKYGFYCDGNSRNIRPHIFYNTIANVVSAYRRGSSYLGCPVCSGRSIIKGINDFKTLNPNCSKIWDYSKNSVDPEDVYAYSPHIYYFKCSHGHEFSKDLIHMMRSKGSASLGCPVCANRIVVKGVNDLKTLRPDLIQYWLWDENEITPDSVVPGSNKIITCKCRNPQCGKTFKTSVASWSSGFVIKCEECRKKSYSASQLQIAEYIRNLGFEIYEEYPINDGEYYLDIYIPGLSLGVEYNGIYWHSDLIEGRNKFYHWNKLQACSENGISLFVIWEDDFNSKKDLVYRMLKNKLGISSEEKVNARDCKIELSDSGNVYEFLQENNLLGYTTGSSYLKLTHKGNLVAVMVAQWVSDAELQIKRYCTSCNVRGGFSKLVKFLEDNYSPNIISTFSDNSVSNGDLYRNNGFVVEKSLKPDYTYYVKGKRVHKLNYKKSRFKKDPKLKYEENITEEELARLNNLGRVWDYGKIKWVKRIVKN